MEALANWPLMNFNGVTNRLQEPGNTDEIFGSASVSASERCTHGPRQIGAARNPSR